MWTPARTSEGLRDRRFPWESTHIILGPLAMKTSADSAEGYSGPTQESKIPESFWGWSLGLKLPRTSFCAKVRAQNQAVSTGSCPAPASGHPTRGWHVAGGEQCLLGEQGRGASGHSPDPGGGGRVPLGCEGSLSCCLRPRHGHRANKLTWRAVTTGREDGLKKDLRQPLDLGGEGASPRGFSRMWLVSQSPQSSDDTQRLRDCVTKAPTMKLSSRLILILILPMCEFKHIS